MSARADRGDAGFSMIEALAALLLTGLVLSGIALLTGQWLPTWNAGFQRSQRLDILANALDRAATDIAAAEFVSFGEASLGAYFHGAPNAVTFVRRTLGPASPPGLEVVRWTEASDRRGEGLLRARAPFSMAFANLPASSDLEFPESTFAVRGAYVVTFSYLDREHVWRETWGARSPPVAVRVEARDRATGALLLGAAARIHVTAPSSCVRMQSVRQCIAY